MPNYLTAPVARRGRRRRPERDTLRVLLLSAYDAHSHRRWREGLVAAFPGWDWTVLALPPRHFLWRVRGNSLSWAFSERGILEQPYDVMVATSMTDLSALKGMVPALASVPSLVYCHENQFVYPDRRGEPRNEPRFTSLYALLAPDRLAYPEYIPDDYRYASFPDDPDAEAEVIAAALQSLCRDHEQGRLPVAPAVGQYSWRQLRPAYGDVIDDLA